jgi:hypothetical protein
MQLQTAEQEDAMRTAGAPANAKIVDPVSKIIASSAVADYEEIARLAYSYWESRGCPVGSPEEDWFRAESELQKQAAAVAA